VSQGTIGETGGGERRCQRKDKGRNQWHHQRTEHQPICNHGDDFPYGRLTDDEDYLLVRLVTIAAVIKMTRKMKKVFGEFMNPHVIMTCFLYFSSGTDIVQYWSAIRSVDRE
jgi:hypothetical protein